MKGLGGAEYDERLLRSPLLTSIDGWRVGMSGSKGWGAECDETSL